jgi:hypothetical protein
MILPTIRVLYFFFCMSSCATRACGSVIVLPTAMHGDAERFSDRTTARADWPPHAVVYVDCPGLLAIEEFL